MGNFSMHYPIIEGPFAPGASGNVCTEDLVHMFDAMGFDTPSVKGSSDATLARLSLYTKM